MDKTIYDGSSGLDFYLSKVPLFDTTKLSFVRNFTINNVEISAYSDNDHVYDEPRLSKDKFKETKSNSLLVEAGQCSLFCCFQWHRQGSRRIPENISYGSIALSIWLQSKASLTIDQGGFLMILYWRKIYCDKPQTYSPSNTLNSCSDFCKNTAIFTPS